MTARYQLVYYVPDTFLGERIVLGAHVWDAAGVSDVVVRPLDGALGRMRSSDDRVHHLRELLRGLEVADPAVHVPTALGPDVELGPKRDVPASVIDAAAWVRSLLTGRVSVAEWVLDASTTQLEQRNTYWFPSMIAEGLCDIELAGVIPSLSYDGSHANMLSVSTPLSVEKLETASPETNSWNAIVNVQRKSAA